MVICPITVKSKVFLKPVNYFLSKLFRCLHKRICRVKYGNGINLPEGGLIIILSCGSILYLASPVNNVEKWYKLKEGAFQKNQDRPTMMIKK